MVINLSNFMVDKALEAAFDAGLVPDGSSDSRAKVEAMLAAGLSGAWFDDLVRIGRALLDEHYPASIFTGVSGDPGPVFVAKMREALAALPEDLGKLMQPPKPTYAQLEAELHTMRVERANRLADAERLNAWLDDPNRLRAGHAFTEGAERQIAYRVEDLLSRRGRAEKGDKG